MRLLRGDLLRLVALLAVAMLVAGACSGGGSETLSAGDAAAIAADSLLVVEDLPAADWQQEESQTSLDGLIPDAAGDAQLDLLPDACAPLEEAISDLPALLGEAEPLNTSSRTFSAAGQLVNFKAVSSNVVVFDTSDGASDAAEALGEALSADNLEDCLQAAVLPAGDNGLQITDFSLSTPDYALEDSTALRVSVEATALIIPIKLSLDIHSFQRDHVLGLYVALELNSDDLEAANGQLLETFAERIETAQDER
jgi:hypothetical protein